MSTSPLVNLVQAIHLPSFRFLLTTSVADPSATSIDLHLFAHTPSSDGNGGDSSDGSGSGYGADGNRLPTIIVWEGKLDLKARDVEQDVFADAIKRGYLHVDMPMTNTTELSVAEELDLKILPPDRDPSTYRLTSIPSSAAIPHLLEATFELLSRPTAIPDKTEVRSLRSQLSQKDAEIATLSAKLASAKATVVRATASDNSNKKKMLSPVKKTPANASALQPNVKRRKVVQEDEDGDFAGSGSD